jgi:hypothetical protein
MIHAANSDQDANGGSIVKILLIEVRLKDQATGFPITGSLDHARSPDLLRSPDRFDSVFHPLIISMQAYL